MALLPPLDDKVLHVANTGRPSKEFFNWIKSLHETVRGNIAGIADNKTALINMSTVSTVAGLPSPSPAGQRRFASDAGPPIGFGGLVTGGGSNFIPVYSDGTNWREG
jgi:hypothetical protein